MEPQSRRLMASLRPGESILWMGRPRRSLIRWQEVFWLIVMAALAFRTISRLRPRDDPFDVLYIATVAVVLAGAVLAIVRRLQLEYAVTSERVLIARRFPRPDITSVELAALDHVELVRENDGSERLLFVESTFGLLPGVSGLSPDPDVPYPQLEGLPDAASVKEVIERAKSNLK
jgi:hypothetical protein